MPSRKRYTACFACLRSGSIPITRRLATTAGSGRSTRAYSVLSDPEKRARFDVNYEQHRRNRWRLVSTGAKAESDFDMEQMIRLTLLEALYTKRRIDPGSPSIYPIELETMLGRAREHLEFTIWYLVQRKHVMRDDQSRLMITADGVDYLEQNYRGALQHKRLQQGTEPH